MRIEYAEAVHSLVQAKVEQRAPAVELEAAKNERPRWSTSWRPKEVHADKEPNASERSCSQANGRSRTEGAFFAGITSFSIRDASDRALVVTNADQFPAQRTSIFADLRQNQTTGGRAPTTPPKW
jgi:hypothetical protein